MHSSYCCCYRCRCCRCCSRTCEASSQTLSHHRIPPQLFVCVSSVFPRWARETGKPLLGVCLGFQCMVVEHCRTLLGWEGANSTECDEATPHPVVIFMPEVNKKGVVGNETERLRRGGAKGMERERLREGNRRGDSRERNREVTPGKIESAHPKLFLHFFGCSGDALVWTSVQLERAR